MQEREFDVVLYGASGFTGQQTVQYFAQYAPPGVRWAIAGRNRDKLESLHADVPVFVADSANPQQLLELAARTRVMLSTAGPFARYSDGLVDACVRAQTHYVDITGEIAWVRSIIDRYHERAAAQGTRIVPFCGFDSVPGDVAVGLLRQHFGTDLVEAKAYFQVRGSGPNGGTIASAQASYSKDAAEMGRDLFLLCPREARRPPQPLERDSMRPRYDPEVQTWVAPFFMSFIDTRVVRRSCSLAGADVAYQEYIILHGPRAAFNAWQVAGVTALFQKLLRMPSVLRLLTKLFKPGAGPTKEQMDKGSFRCRVRGRTADGRKAEAILADRGDPANRVTVKCVCESALAIVCNPELLPARAGLLTPSTGLGDALVHRLRERGMTITLTNVP